MSGGGIEMIHERINNLGDEEIGAIAFSPIKTVQRWPDLRPGAPIMKINCRRLDGV